MKHFLLLLLLWPALLYGAEPLRFAVVAGQDRQATIREFMPLLDAIRHSTGQPTRLVMPDNFEQLIDAVAVNQVDLAFVGPLPYVLLRQRHPDTELLLRFREADGSLTFRCALVAFRGDQVRLAKLQGPLVGLPQPLSTCGPLAADGLLRKHAGIGLQQARPRFLGHHGNVALATLAGEVTIGGMSETIAHQYAGLGLEVLARSEPLPGFALVVNRATLDAGRIAELRQSLLATPAAVYRGWGPMIRHGMVAEASDADYDAVRALARAARLLPEGARP